jgi:hypothetical protein
MRVAISQPTYLPWLGYLDLIDQVDTFVFLDTVQFEKRSWQQRNRIKVPGGLSILTVPVIVKGRFAQRIRDVEIESPYFIHKHLRSIETNYRRSPFFARHFTELAGILEGFAPGAHLADLNVQLVRWLCTTLGVRTPLLRASEMDQEGCRSELLLKLCEALSADRYLSVPGSAGYLLNDVPQFSAAGIEVAFQHYEHPKYQQQFPPFWSHASAIDLLFNEGDRSLDILRSGRKTPLRPDEVRLCEKERVADS